MTTAGKPPTKDLNTD